MNNVDNEKIFNYFEMVQCASEVTEQMVTNTASMHIFQNFKSIFDLMKSNLQTCNVLRDIQDQNMWVDDFKKKKKKKNTNVISYAVIRCRNQSVLAVYNAYKVLTKSLAKVSFMPIGSIYLYKLNLMHL